MIASASYLMVTDRFQGTALSNLSLSVPDTKGNSGDALAKPPSHFGQTPAPALGGPASGSPAPTTSSAAPTSSSASPPSSASASAEPSAQPSEAPKPTPSKAPEPPRAQDGSLAAQVVDLVNAERAEAGCSPVSNESRLTAAAQGHSDDMSARNYFSHTTPEGVTFDQRIRAAGYDKPGAENIAKGQSNAAKVMAAWMNSEGHRANILNCKLKKIGVGVNTKGMYWTQNFGY
ncbi:CAP domain-containing protein [Amycolatopsis sp. QT-25]|uniref:CAP domain-containing protein n=1 Tax=Amycolatopsis sp. QT-25 TaxID=3034022 RepID=UPI0023ED06D0|nr:CAP domain-containing protein [Amycolatopsis sp. QT-25]WET83395.1 CAP domain-containing protein [Amycolatopsis sp. QT-25]